MARSKLLDAKGQIESLFPNMVPAVVLERAVELAKAEAIGEVAEAIQKQNELLEKQATGAGAIAAAIKNLGWVIDRKPIG